MLYWTLSEAQRVHAQQDLGIPSQAVESLWSQHVENKRALVSCMNYCQNPN